MTIPLIDWLASSGRDFTEIKLESFLDRDRLLALFEVSERTFRRWESKNNYPRWAVKLLASEAGYLKGESRRGWRVARDGRLYAPDLRDGFTPDDITNLHYLRQRCAELERLNQAPAQYLLNV